MTHQRDPAAWAAARAVGIVSQQLVSKLAQASSAQVVGECLSTCLQLLNSLSSNIQGSRVCLELPENHSSQNRVPDDLQQCQQLLELQAAALGWPALRTIFLEDQFETWACAVLAVAAGEWLPKLQGADRDRLWGLIIDTFTQCPAWNALSALLGHLSAVTPQGSGSSAAGAASVTALAADSAAQLLVQRFLALDSTGLQELLAACDTTSSSSSSSSSNSNPAQQTSRRDAGRQQQQQQQQLVEERTLQAVALLAALPDRLQLLRPVIQQLPSAPEAVTVLVQGCIKYIAAALEGSQGGLHGRPATTISSSTTSDPDADGKALGTVESSSSSSSSSGECGAAAVPGAVHFTASLLQKLVTRGHSTAVAAAVLDLAVKGVSATGCRTTASSYCNGAGDGAGGSGAGAATASSSAADAGPPVAAHGGTAVNADTAAAAAAAAAAVVQQQYLPALQQVLLLLSSWPSAAASVQKLLLRLLRAASNSLPAQQQQQQRESQALTSLVAPLLALSAQLRTVVLHKILLTRTLPTNALQLLLLLLTACTPSVLPEATAVLAQCWCDSSTILGLSVSQQAFITAALVACIRQIPKGYLDTAVSVQKAAEAASTAAAAAGKPATSALCSAAEQLGATVTPYQGLAPEQASTLLSFIIQGVSARLASPSPAIRVQAMRVGRGFAEKLDRTKPMFEDAGPLDLMPEEIWPGAVPAVGSTAAAEQQQQQQHGNAAGRASNSSSSAVAGASAASSSYRALARLAEAAEGSDSDDEDQNLNAAAAAASAAAGRSAGLESTSHAARGPANGTAAAAAAATHDADWDEGSEADSEGSASSLVAFDLQEDLAAEQWWGPDGLGPVDSKGLGLRALAAALRKQDDVDGALAALRKVEVLVRAEPDELAVVAPELARSLIHCKVPIWATAPTSSSPTSASTGAGAGASSSSSSAAAGEPQAHVPKGVSSSAEVQRQRALTALLSVSPLTTGDTVIAELYSPNLDQHQRMVILDGLAAAAAEMADPRKAPQLALQGPQKAPELLPPAAAAGRAQRAALPGATPVGEQRHSGLQSAAATNGTSAAGGTASSANRTRSPGGVSSSSSSSAVKAGGKSQAAPGLVETSSRVWGKVSLQKQAEAAADLSATSSSSRRTFRNRFAPVALRWAAALLQQCDVKQQGIDLFGRDGLLLGRLLTVLGSFVEAAAETPAAVPLCAGLLELLKAQEVSGHKEAFVRRSALVAASQVVRNLPSARLAGAMVGRQSDAQDQILLERLQWLMSWAQQVAESDVDQHCKMLAAGCVAWHVELAEGAMAVLEHLPQPEGPSLVTTDGRKAAGKQGDIHVQLPTVDRLVLS